MSLLGINSLPILCFHRTEPGTGRSPPSYLSISPSFLSFSLLAEHFQRATSNTETEQVGNTHFIQNKKGRTSCPPGPLDSNQPCSTRQPYSTRFLPFRFLLVQVKFPRPQLVFLVSCRVLAEATSLILLTPAVTSLHQDCRWVVA